MTETCECVYDCAEEPATACSMTGDWHVHVAGECPVHPDAQSASVITALGGAT